MKPTIRDRPALDMSNELWKQALEELRLQMTKATFQTWLAHSYVIGLTRLPAGLTVVVRNNYAKEWLTHRLQGVVNQTLSAIAGQPVTVDFIVNSHPLEDLIMPGLGSRIDADLGQQSGEESLSHSIRLTRRFDMLLARAGIIPTYVLELPRNITIDDILLRGGRDPMTTQNKPIRVRIYSHITQSTFLHVEDALSIGKLRLFAGSYKRGRGITSNAHHFLDTADARVILLALAQAEPGFTYREYKGSANGGTDVISRVFSVKAKGDRIYVELKNGPGKLTNTGAIQPNGRPAAEITIPFKTYEAQRLALEVLAYLHAWDVMRLGAQRELISGFPPYLLSPPPLGDDPAESIDGLSDGQADDGNSSVSPAKPVHKTIIGEPAANAGASAQDLLSSEESVGASELRPKTYGDLTGSDHASTPSSQLLHYQDGTLVEPANENESRAFLQYRKVKGEDPHSLVILRNFFLQNHKTG